MKRKSQILIGCTVGLAATVAFFVSLKAPPIRVNQERPPAAPGKSNWDGSKGESRPHPSVRPGFTRAVRSGDPTTSHSHAFSLRKSRIDQAADRSSFPTTDRNHPSGALSGLPASGFHALFSQRFHGKRSREISKPLICTDPGSVVFEEPELHAALLAAAKQLAIDLAAPGYAPDSPEYLDHWNRTVDLSNQLLRQRYGGQVWMAHHIQSHHFQTASGEENQ